MNDAQRVIDEIESLIRQTTCKPERDRHLGKNTQIERENRTSESVKTMSAQDPKDIRNWLSPKSNTSTPKRRIRVMSTSSSDNERNGPDSNSAARIIPNRSAPLPIAAATNNAQTLPSRNEGKKSVAISPNAEDVIELSSSDDSMYILRTDAQTAGGGAAVTSPRPAAKQQRSSSKVNRPRSSTKRERSRCGSSSKPQNFTVEAEEASTTDYETDSESCAESELNAQDQYREAIMGVRRANNARSQLRNATINCPVCAKFAAVLQHFTA
jgi:hypothetical protein